MSGLLGLTKYGTVADCTVFGLTVVCSKRRKEGIKSHATGPAVHAASQSSRLSVRQAHRW